MRVYSVTEFFSFLVVITVLLFFICQKEGGNEASVKCVCFLLPIVYLIDFPSKTTFSYARFHKYFNDVNDNKGHNAGFL